ncbi:DUF4321 domain-containing protein [Paenibacillus yanchengensis]|uniref:DUF4321 domain-containing protein n=1 Tax=Paenibacillus yanchengensis TaxID=2035833 RepID=A0ABW4YL69_9BACL
MKKNGWILFIFIVFGLLAGALIAKWLEPLQGIAFLTKSLEAQMAPKLDLYVMQLNFDLSIQISMLSIVGGLLAIWLYKKL